jgi:hypothetical protein
MLRFLSHFSRLFDKSAPLSLRRRAFAGGSAQPSSPMSDQVLARAMRDLEDLQRDLSEPDQQHLAKT